MSAAFYVRIRGRVHGPIDRAKLDTLVARGQLSRIHEISGDGQNWRPAAAMPELFVAVSTAPDSRSPVPKPTTRSISTAAEGPVASADPGFVHVDDPWENDSASPADDSTSWYYAVNGAQQGPIGSAELVELIRTRRLSNTDMVWKSDMENWAEAGSVPSLAAYFQSASGRTSGVAASSTTAPFAASGGTVVDQINYELQQWSSAVGWARNAAFLLGVVLIGFGVVCLVACAMLFSIPQLVLGVVHVVVGAFVLWLGVHLVALKKELTTAGEARSGATIVDAIRTATTAWKSLAWTLAALMMALVVLLTTAFAIYQPV
ncbi:GYF domain-containing protein [Neorhodopirellula pilleata]|uniref:GYF domain-containing protein n=1 Tax=Neorhodopirellula pilleata TaxID=2714738 RepID=A0A5C5ZW79_9BACT|nr:GYF domain-containing protein [Neorhodopirellula pilleata]TWT91844.1 hypothetical protein Pla100_48820 [Neorhodopirellula pilleata]